MTQANDAVRAQLVISGAVRTHLLSYLSSVEALTTERAGELRAAGQADAADRWDAVALASEMLAEMFSYDEAPLTPRPERIESAGGSGAAHG